MDDDLKKIKKTATLMKNLGILTLKLPNLELSISPQTLLEREQKLKEPPVSEEGGEKPTYTDQDVLFWSSPGGTFQEETSH